MGKTQAAYKLFPFSKAPATALGKEARAPTGPGLLHMPFEFFQTELWFAPGVNFFFL